MPAKQTHQHSPQDLNKMQSLIIEHSKGSGYNPKLVSIQRTKKIATHLREKIDTPRKHSSCKHQSQKSWHGSINIRQVDFRTKKTRGDKKGHSRMIKGLICQEDITILNMYASHNRASKTHGSKNWQNWKEKEKNPKLQLETSALLPVIDRTGRQKGPSAIN